MANLCKLMQDFIGVEVINGNVLRNQEPGVVRDIQDALCDIDLRSAPATVEYTEWLDTQTEKILAGLSVKTPPWGTVRKAINLFMRGCIRDYELREEFDLKRLETLAEMPLDRIVANALKREAGRGKLPQWPGLKHLTSSDNSKFQAFAAGWAEHKGIHRIYLDNYLWLTNRE